MLAFSSVRLHCCGTEFNQIGCFVSSKIVCDDKCKNSIHSLTYAQSPKMHTLRQMADFTGKFLKFSGDGTKCFLHNLPSLEGDSSKELDFVSAFCSIACVGFTKSRKSCSLILNCFYIIKSFEILIYFGGNKYFQMNGTWIAQRKIIDQLFDHSDTCYLTSDKYTLLIRR